MWPVGQQNSLFVLKYFIFIFENFEIIQPLSRFAVYGIRLDATALYIFHRPSKFSLYTGSGWMQRLFSYLTVTTGFGYRFDAMISLCSHLSV
jgi:hypothetical protein